MDRSEHNMTFRELVYGRPDKRRNERHNVSAHCRIAYPGKGLKKFTCLPVTIQNISQSGALLSTKYSGVVPNWFYLLLEDGPNAPVCMTAGRDKDAIRVQFLNEIEPKTFERFLRACAGKKGNPAQEPEDPA